MNLFGFWRIKKRNKEAKLKKKAESSFVSAASRGDLSTIQAKCDEMEHHVRYQAFSSAIQHNRLDIVVFLAQRVNWENRFAGVAAEEGHKEIALFLLQNQHEYGGFLYLTRQHYDSAIESAIKQKDLSFVMSVLGLPKAQDHIHPINLSKAAIEQGCEDIALFLLNHPKNKECEERSRDDRDELLGLAAKKNFHKIVRRLFKEPKINVAADHNYALRMAARHGCLESLKLLISHPRVDVSALDDIALRESVHCGNPEVFSELLAHKATNTEAWLGFLKQEAEENNYQDMLEVIKDYAEL